MRFLSRLCSILTLVILLPSLHADIVVLTFEDLNNNGKRDSGESLVTGLQVTGFDDHGNEFPFLDDAMGTFTLPGPVIMSRLRVVVRGYDAKLLAGKNSATSVFFAEDGDTFEVPVLGKPAQDPNTTNILIPCYEKGSSLLKKDSPAFVRFPFAARGVAKMFGGTGPNPIVDASISELGSTWGVTYQRSFKRAFAASILKRHVGLGPRGIGAVYTLDYTSAKPVIGSIDLQGIMPSQGPPIDLGSVRRDIVDVEIDETMPYALSTIEDRTRRASYDLDAFDKVGQIGYGDIEMAEDGRTLWMVNLNQRSLITMDVDETVLDPRESVIKHYLIDDLPGLPNLLFRFRACINAGGNSNNNGSEAFTDSNKVSWDKNKYSFGGQAGYSELPVTNTLNNSDKTSSTGLYQTFRRGDFSYSIPVPKDETYEVLLHFSEPEDLMVGDRLFDIMQGDQMLIENFDIVKFAGGNRKAAVLKLSVTSQDQKIELNFVSKFAGKRKEALLAGLEIVGQTISESGILRPWGLAFHEGRGYLGMISDASYSQSREHLFAYVLSFDPENIQQGFTEELAFPLNYPRERASNAHLKNPQPLRSAAWMPWVSNWEQTMIPTIGEPLSVQGGLLCAYAQPILSEISFTSDGSIVIGLMDRWAHQTGHLNYSTNLGDRTLVIGYAAGDLLKAFKEPVGFTLEKVNSDDGVYYRKDDGPSYKGEFFYEENFISTLAHHGEVITGGQAILPGSDAIAVTVHSPILTKLPAFQYEGLLTQGLHFYDVTTGRRIGDYLFVEQFILGKANGLGDITLAIEAAPPSVGNYVWCDANGNGIQDPSEFGINDVTVSLHDGENAFTEIETKTTINGGQFFFDGLLPNHRYELRIDLAELLQKGYSGGVSPIHSADPLIDSDADEISVPGYAVIEFYTGNDGLNRDDLDFGFLGPQALDAQKIQCEDLNIPPPGIPCADFSLPEIRLCASEEPTTNVRIFPSFSDANNLTNEIVADVRVCGMDSLVYARVAVNGDPFCFAISEIHLMVQPGAGGLVVDFVELTCPMDFFDALAYLQQQGFRGDATTEFFLDANHTIPFTGNPSALDPASFPYVLFYDDTIIDGGCGVPGSITLNAIPESEVFAGNDTSLCGLDCIDLTLLRPTFYANGTGATEAVWSSSGTGTFVDDHTFANAHFYCPDAADLENGQVTLSLTVIDDPCVSPGPSSSVLITLTAGTPSFLDHPRDTIDCYHPFAADPAAFDTFPGCQLVLECIDTLDGEVVDYEILVGDCYNIIKEIKRTLKFTYDKQEFFCMDTIAIRALPDTVICPPMRDSVYCVPGYLKDENGHPSPLETGVPMAGDIPLWPPPPSECDILIHYHDVEFNGLCPMTIRRNWYIKNGCTGAFDTCVQWLMVFDTTGPVITKIDTAAFSVAISTGTHDCFAEVYVPKIMVEDTCVGVKQVKAMIGQQVVLLTFNPTTGYYESHVKVKVPVSEIDILNGLIHTIYVSYEAIDSCHNKTLLDSLPLFIVDKVKPVTICDKGINLTITDSIAWVHAASFDEGSWDNCAISLLFARRSDWATACGVNLCDDISFLFESEHHDSIWFAQLEEDKLLNPVEAHYQQAIDWLCKDGQPCSYPFLIGWFYDLVKYATLDCIDHPYPVNADNLYKLFLESYGDDPLLDIYQSLILSVIPCITPFDADSLFVDYFEDPVNQQVLQGLLQDIFKIAIVNGPESGKALFDVGRQIGGGWSDAVPFCCEDACQDVMVEVIAMDYWCNWSKCWTTVRVEDKTPPEVVCDLYDATVTCSAYKKYYAAAVEMALEGDFDSLQSVLGRYDKVTKDSYGKVPPKTSYKLYDLTCDSNLVKKDTLVFDEHLGYIWKTYSYYRAEYDLKTYDRFNGQVADNCGLQCIEEKPWISLDECGNGFIKRVFKFVGQCISEPSGHFADTITRYQTIWVTSDCSMSKAMFEVPNDTMIYSCGIEYNTDGSGHVAGALSPEYTGTAEYVFDNDCRLVGIGYYDKVFKIVGGDQACYKILRTWCFADWCALGEPIEKSWWFNSKYAGKYLTCTQKIIVFDDSPPICTIDEIPVEIEAAGCTYDLNTVVVVEDECGILDFSWRVFNLKSNESVASGYGELNSLPLGSFAISATGLGQGSYQLKITVTDECQNESICYSDFTVKASKKPTPVCITSLTTDLTPMDINGDGLVDTAMATVWASEFNVSSQAACGSSSSKLSYRVDRATGEAVLPPASSTNLNLGCEDVGSQVVRLYIIDDLGNWDYCSVILIVQDNSSACHSGSGNSVVISGTIMTEEAQMVELVNVILESEKGDVLQTFQSNGDYQFDVERGIKPKIHPYKNTDYVNGVSTRDLISIQKQILGKEELSSWYKKRAADANGDGKISALDLIQFRKLILGKSESLPESPSWRFFERNTNQESYFIEELTESLQVDFIGVKMGDVNGDNDPTRRTGRSAKTLAFVLQDQKLIAGDVYKFPVLASGFRDIEGFQFTLLFDEAIQMLGLDPGALSVSPEHFYINQQEQFVTMSWNTQTDIPIGMEDGSPLFYIHVLALEPGPLSDMMTLNGSRIPAEVYLQNTVGDLALKFLENDGITGDLIVEQNQPNPFKTETKVGFYVDEAQQVQLSVYDLNGTQLQTIRRLANKGYNEWNIRDLPANLSSALLYYKVETAKQTAIKKMILIR